VRTEGASTRRGTGILLISLALFAVTALVAPAAGSDAAVREVRVKLIDYMVESSSTTTAAGRVTFVVHNADGVPHNLVVLRTRRRPSSLPVTGAHGRAREVGRVGGTRRLQDEETVRLTLTLRAGRYLLICNVPGHYQRGMVVRLRARG
jgi:uncharacterized cupredoxin-like copper-binding protein